MCVGPAGWAGAGSAATPETNIFITINKFKQKKRGHINYGLLANYLIILEMILGPKVQTHLDLFSIISAVRSAFVISLKTKAIIQQSITNLCHIFK